MFSRLGKRIFYDDKSKDNNGRFSSLSRRNYERDISITNSYQLYTNRNGFINKKESKLVSLFKCLVNRKNENKTNVDLESKSIYNKIISESSVERKASINFGQKSLDSSKKVEEIVISSGESSPIVLSERGEKTISVKETSSEVETIAVSSKEPSPDLNLGRYSKLHSNENFSYKSIGLAKLEMLNNEFDRLLEYSLDNQKLLPPKPLKSDDISFISSPFERNYEYYENSQLSTPKTSSVGSRKRVLSFIEDEKRIELNKKIKFLEIEANNQAIGFQENLNLHDIVTPRRNFLEIKIIDTSYKKLPKDINNVLMEIDNVGENDVLSEGFSIAITKSDIKHLDDRTWLNDNIINFYMELIMDRSKNSLKYPKVHAFNTFFYQNIVNPQRGYSMVRRWTRKVDIFQMKYIFVPINLDNVHWCMAIIDVPNKEIRYCDSMRKKNLTALQVLKDYIKKEAADKLKIDINLDEWTAIHAQDVPEQQNGYDCGVFSCMFAEYTSRERDFEFTQNDMPLFRQQMKYEIIKKDLVN